MFTFTYTPFRFPQRTTSPSTFTALGRMINFLVSVISKVLVVVCGRWEAILFLGSLGLACRLLGWSAIEHDPTRPLNLDVPIPHGHWNTLFVGAAPRPRRVGEANAPVPRGELCVALAPTPSGGG
jgi:hypothetical protein